MELKDPWGAPRDARALERELAAEVSPGHVLAGVDLKAIARRHDQDDVLFQLLDGSARVAVVHLTYAGRGSREWPRATLYPSLEVWRLERMLPDSEEFNA